MATIIFHFNGISINIQATMNQTFEQILLKFESKAKMSIKNLLFIYNGQLINNYKLSIEQIANSIDKQRKIIDILVSENKLYYQNEKNDFEKEKISIKEKINQILYKYLGDRTYLKDKINNWKDAILNECKILFLKYQNYITFVSLVIFNKSIKQSNYFLDWAFIAGETTQIIDVYFNSDNIKAQINVGMFLKERERTKKDLTKALNLAEKEFLNLAEGRTFDTFHDKYFKMFENTLENEILTEYKYSLFYFNVLLNKYTQYSKGFIIVNKNKEDYYLSKEINAGESILYLLFGKAQ